MCSVKYNEPPVVLLAKFDYKANEPQELDLKKGERLLLLDNSKNWWQVQKFETNQIGYASMFFSALKRKIHISPSHIHIFRYIPSNYVKKEKKSILEKLLSKRSKRTNNTNLSHDTNDFVYKSCNEQTLRKNKKAIVKHKYIAKK
jgi:hypothetical protein